MKSTGRAIGVLAAIVSCAVALPVIAQDNPNAGGGQPGRRQRSRTNRPARTPRERRTEPMAAPPTEVRSDSEIQRNIRKADDTLDNMVKLLDSIDARKAGGGSAPAPAGQ